MQKILCKCCGQFKMTSEFENIEHSSVDFNFCQKASEAGFKIFVDPEASMGHIGEASIVTKETFLEQMKKLYIKKNEL